ncbi:integrase core domain-containing protein, partial [Pontibacter harenae]
MSRKGNYWDNAVAESFFKTMKTETVYHHIFATGKEAQCRQLKDLQYWSF